MAGVTANVRRLVLNRDGYSCLRCSAAIDPSRGDYSLQHRRARGMGGSVRLDTNLPQNLVTLCGSATTGCHGWVETHREAAQDAGWTIRQGEDPLLIAVRDYLRAWWFLNENGTRTRAA